MAVAVIIENALSSVSLKNKRRNLYYAKAVGERRINPRAMTVRGRRSEGSQNSPRGAFTPEFFSTSRVPGPPGQLRGQSR